MSSNPHGYGWFDDSACKKTECRHEMMILIDHSTIDRKVPEEQLITDIWVATRFLHWSTIDGFRADNGNWPI